MRVLSAYPLFINDPYFSVWSNTETLNGSDTVFWTKDLKKTYGLIVANGKTYCFLGDAPNVEKLKQTSISVTAFRTTYSFTSKEFDLKVSFFSPMPATDLEIWSCPTCYLEYQIFPKTELSGVAVTLTLHESWCYCLQGHQETQGNSMPYGNIEIAYFGLRRQHLFNQAGDRVAADWGNFYVAAERTTYYHTVSDFNAITSVENVWKSQSEEERYLTAQNLHGAIQSETFGKIVVGYDDIVSIDYYGEPLRGYYFADGRTMIDAMRFTWNAYARICEGCARVERDLHKRAEKYGEAYLNVLNASYRQALGANKLVKDGKGRTLLISKECGSGGCSATVDVTYPSMPILLLYAPELVRASIEPIFDFAKTEVWKYEFAPHDAGIYPYCNGQMYGLKREQTGRHNVRCPLTEDKQRLYSTAEPYYTWSSECGIYDYAQQMPVEECSNMLVIMRLYLASGGDVGYVREKYPILKGWCQYLIDRGLVPENQLCTDDYLQAIDQNCNLAVKSIVAIRAFADLAELCGENGKPYREIAEARAKELVSAYPNRLLPVSFLDDKNGDTFSMKYNFMAAKLLGYDLFPQTIYDRELAEYEKRSEKYGFPLFQGSNLTKPEWMLFSATLTENMEFKKQTATRIERFLRECEERSPFPDLYDCVSGETKEFANRTVVGGNFIFLLQDKLLE